MLERGDPGDVLVQDVVLALLGWQRPQLLDSGVQIAGRPQYGGIQHETEWSALTCGKADRRSRGSVDGGKKPVGGRTHRRIEAHRAAGKRGEAEVHRAAGERGAAEAHHATGECGAVEVQAAVDGDAGEVEIAALPGAVGSPGCR